MLLQEREELLDVSPGVDADSLSKPRYAAITCHALATEANMIAGAPYEVYLAAHHGDRLIAASSASSEFPARCQIAILRIRRLGDLGEV